MSGWIWVAPAVVRAIHLEQLARHGGAAGLRDENTLLAALARPQQRATYEEPDAADIAAAYAWSLARSHPFVDGNKRTALVVAELFLELNGHTLEASDAECVLTLIAVAAGDMDEQALGQWLRANMA